MRGGSGFRPTTTDISADGQHLVGSYGAHGGDARLEISAVPPTRSRVADLREQSGDQLHAGRLGAKQPLAPGLQLLDDQPRRGTAQFALYGRFVGSIDNGGYVRIAGDALIATQLGSSGVFRIGASTTTFTPALYAQKALRIGDNGIAGAGGGFGDFRLYKGSVVVGGPCTLGDPDGHAGSGASRLHVEGGSMRMSGGFTRSGVTTFSHLGGTIHVDGGAIITTSIENWSVSSMIGAPELWISNGLNTTMGSLKIGRGGQGRLRLARPDTRVTVTNGLFVGDSALGVGSIVIDSSAVLGTTYALVGNEGSGDLTVIRGGRVEVDATLTFGRVAGSSAVGRVSGVGSRISVGNRLDVGGVSGTPGGASHLTVDSSAVVEVTDFNGVAWVQEGTGRLTVRDGATFRSNVFTLDGVCDLAAAVLDVAHTQVGATGSLLGRGLVMGNLQSFGLVDLTPSAGSLGVLRTRLRPGVAVVAPVRAAHAVVRAISSFT
jgi:hypothetical protein